MKQVGLILLAMTPVIDLILIITMSVDLLNGAKATVPHGIAAVYIGVSIAFGKQMIQWADERFKYYVLKEGNLPEKKTGNCLCKSLFCKLVKTCFSLFDWNRSIVVNYKYCRTRR